MHRHEQHVDGADLEIYPDFKTRKVVSRFTHPETGETLMEVHLDPETAREYALEQTRASIALEDHERH